MAAPTKRRVLDDDDDDDDDEEKVVEKKAVNKVTADEDDDVVDAKDDDGDDDDATEALPEDRSRSRLLATLTTHGIEIQVRHGDICQEDVSIVTNAANGSLAHGSGVAGALRRAGGSEFQKLSDEWIEANGTLDEGEVAVTESGNGSLLCRYVVHAVGPIYRHGAHAASVELLKAAVRNTLEKAHQLNAESVALPAISSGIFGFPKPLCAQVMFDCAEAFAAAHGDGASSVKQIRFTNFDRETVDIFLAERAKRGD